ncbi:MAG: CRTAC1 family protein [Acidobacteriota bacterium]
MPAVRIRAACALLSVSIALALLPPYSRAAAQKVWFRDVTREAGIDFTHTFGDRNFSNLVEAVGGGAAWFDYDGDGNLDLYLATGSYTEGLSQGDRPRGVSGNRLYRNRGDGTFEDVTKRAGVSCRGCYSLAAAAADFDNDGDSDLYVANFGANVLYRNDGNGTFTEVTDRAGVGDPRFSVALTWLDYDRDGWLDLYVGNYIQFDPKYDVYYAPDGFPGPLNYRGQPDALFRNRGDGTFEDVGSQVGLGRPGRAMAAAAVDLDGDGYDDIYVTNDAMENYLYLNQGGKSLREVALMAGVAFNAMADQTASMAVDFGDYDADGLVDIFISDNALSSLFRNEGHGRFSDRSPQAGIAEASAQFVGWGAFFFDYDNDGDLDILKVNSDLSRLFGQEDQLYENLGGGRFQDISDSAGDYFGKEYMGRGAAYADYDNDGDLDVVIANLNGPAVLLRNEGGNNRNSLQISLEGRASNRDGIGTRVEVRAGGLRQVLQRRASGGYLSQNDPRLHVGLGGAARVEELVIRWPSGRSQVLRKVKANQVIEVREPGE